MIKPTQPSGTGTGVGGPHNESEASKPFERSWFRSMFSISTEASRTASSVWPVIVNVLFRGSFASASDGMATFAPLRSWIPFTVKPPLPIIKPILESDEIADYDDDLPLQIQSESLKSYVDDLRSLQQQASEEKKENAE